MTGKDCFHQPLFQKGRIDLAGEITSTQQSKQPTKKSKLQGLPGANAEHSFLNSEESEVEIPESDHFPPEPDVFTPLNPQHISDWEGLFSPTDVPEGPH